MVSKAADAKLAMAENNLGLMYLSGKGVEQDYGKAFELFQRSANQGYDWGMNNLGGLYEKGWGTEQDMAKALFLYREAAAKGNEAGGQEREAAGAACHQGGSQSVSAAGGGGAREVRHTAATCRSHGQACHRQQQRPGAARVPRIRSKASRSRRRCLRRRSSRIHRAGRGLLPRHRNAMLP